MFNHHVLANISAIALAHSNQILFFRKLKADHNFSQPVFAIDSAIDFAHSDQI
jgi:hypothetical protein